MLDFIDHLLNPSADVAEVFLVIFLVLTGACLIVSWAFVFSYGYFYNWRKNASGRSTFYLLLALAATFTVIFLARLFAGDYPGRQLVTLVVYSSILFTLFRLLLVLWSRYTAPAIPGQRSQLRDIDDDTTPHRRHEKDPHSTE